MLQRWVERRESRGQSGVQKQSRQNRDAVGETEACHLHAINCLKSKNKTNKTNFNMLLDVCAVDECVLGGREVSVMFHSNTHSGCL